MGFPLLPQRSAAAELCIINLIAQHDPQPNPHFARHCDPGFSHSFLYQLATIEALQLPIFCCSDLEKLAHLTKAGLGLVIAVHRRLGCDALAIGHCEEALSS